MLVVDKYPMWVIKMNKDINDVEWGKNYKECPSPSVRDHNIFVGPYSLRTR